MKKIVTLKSVLVLTWVSTALTFSVLSLILFSNYFESVQTIPWLKLIVSILYGLILLAEIVVFIFSMNASIKALRQSEKKDRKLITLFVMNLINLFFFTPLTIIMLTILKNLLI